MKSELKMMRKETVMVKFERLPQYFSGGTGKNHENLRVGSVPSKLWSGYPWIQVRGVTA
jgi:hypothetical protein